MVTTAVLLSHHSSNPLEVPTSDPQNTRMNEELLKVRGERGPRKDATMSSDDPLDVIEDEAAYQAHTKDVNVPATVRKLGGSPYRIQSQQAQRRLDENIYTDSDDDLEIVSNDEHDDDEGTPSPIADENAVMDVALDAGEHFDEEAELNSLSLKPQDEQEEIQEEIYDLENAVPEIVDDYKIVDRLGTGTFSSVYKAVDLHYHSKWDNSIWHGLNPPTSSAYYQTLFRPKGSKVFVAIKRIYVTSNPERIKNEISIMEDCLGCRHVAQLITAFRNRDQVVAVMPYQRNDDFRDYFQDYPFEGIKAYFRCLFRALRDIHAREIIHRDVKPANFLFDPDSGRGTLCDFGLASRLIPSYASGSACLHSAPSRAFPHGTIKSKSSYDVELVKHAQREARRKSQTAPDRVGYPEKDMRPVSKANRAGTRGFRAPEVLLKCNDQTGAIDVWAGGMILLFFLTGKFPLFQSNDDIEALMEIAAIIGKRRMEKAATLHNRTFATNVPAISPDGMTWREFVQRNNPNIFRVQSPPPSTSPTASPPSQSTLSGGANGPTSPTVISPTIVENYQEDLEQALDFLEKVLEPDSTQRVTARDALYHPFLMEPDSSLGDDAFFPHPVGEGRCGHYHFRDEVTEEHTVVGPGRKEAQVMRAGEGIPIGNEPCEFHKDMAEFR